MVDDAAGSLQDVTVHQCGRSHGGGCGCSSWCGWALKVKGVTRCSTWDRTPPPSPPRPPARAGWSASCPLPDPPSRGSGSEGGAGRGWHEGQIRREGGGALRALPLFRVRGLEKSPRASRLQFHCGGLRSPF